MTVEARESSVSTSNRATWARGTYLRAYANRRLRPVEVLLMVRFREQFSGRVLELGCGAGRLTGYLVALADEVWGIDISPAMIAECDRRYPDAHLLLGDARDLSSFAAQSFDVVLAGCNLLDVFSDEERRATLRAIRRVLAPGGLLIMSAHNRAYLPRVRQPWEIRMSGLVPPEPLALLRFAADVLRAPRRWRRHLMLRRLEVNTPQYAIVSDGSHEFTLIHYFIDPRSQFVQFVDQGLEPVVAIDLEGRVLEDGYQAPDCPEIHYVARTPLSP